MKNWIKLKKELKKFIIKKLKNINYYLELQEIGFGSKDFHSKCDGKGDTVTIVKSKEGKRFGGYSDAIWDQSNTYKTGSNCFIFSFDNKEIYYNKDSKYNIYCNSKYGPTFGGGGLFGGHDFKITNNCDQNNYSYDNSNDSYNTNGKKYALAGTKNFYVENYEVNQIKL